MVLLRTVHFNSRKLIPSHAENDLNQLIPTLCLVDALGGIGSKPHAQHQLRSLMKAFNMIMLSYMLPDQPKKILPVCCFVALSPEDQVCHYIINRLRLTSFTRITWPTAHALEIRRFLEKLMGALEAQRLQSDEHFAAGRALVQARLHLRQKIMNSNKAHCDTSLRQCLY